MSDSILKGDSSSVNAGSWVYTQQGVAANKGFNHVSKHWYPKTISIEQGIESIENARKNMTDKKVKVKDLQVDVVDDKDGIPQLVYKLDGLCVYPDIHAQSTLAGRIKTPIGLITFYNDFDNKEMNREDALDIIARALNVGADNTDNEKVFTYRLYANGDDRMTCRFVGSEDYGVIDNRWYLEILNKMIPGGRLSHWKGNPDTIYGNVLIPDTIREESDSDYGGMLSISNCEIGKRKLGQYPSIFRAICMNGCIWGQHKGSAYSKKHIHIDTAKLVEVGDAIRTNLQTQIPLTTTGIDMLLVTRNWKSKVGAGKIFAELLKNKDNQFTPAIGQKLAKEWINQGKNLTAFGIIDAVTRVGQTEDADTWVHMDEIAGNLLNEKVWENVTARAATLSDEDVSNILNGKKAKVVAKTIIGA